MRQRDSVHVCVQSYLDVKVWQMVGIGRCRPELGGQTEWEEHGGVGHDPLHRQGTVEDGRSGHLEEIRGCSCPANVCVCA